MVRGQPDVNRTDTLCAAPTLFRCAATIVQRDGKPVFAIGTPGGIRIFPTVLQGIINVIDHEMNLQQSVEAPRIWTMGRGVEVEAEAPENVRSAAHTSELQSPMRISKAVFGLQTQTLQPTKTN